MVLFSCDSIHGFLRQWLGSELVSWSWICVGSFQAVLVSSSALLIISVVLLFENRTRC